MALDEAGRTGMGWGRALTLLLQEEVEPGGIGWNRALNVLPQEVVGLGGGGGGALDEAGRKTCCHRRR